MKITCVEQRMHFLLHFDVESISPTSSLFNKASKQEKHRRHHQRRSTLALKPMATHGKDYLLILRFFIFCLWVKKLRINCEEPKSVLQNRQALLSCGTLLLIRKALNQSSTFAKLPFSLLASNLSEKKKSEN